MKIKTFALLCALPLSSVFAAQPSEPSSPKQGQNSSHRFQLLLNMPTSVNNHEGSSSSSSASATKSTSANAVQAGEPLLNDPMVDAVQASLNILRQHNCIVCARALTSFQLSLQHPPNKAMAIQQDTIRLHEVGLVEKTQYVVREDVITVKTNNWEGTGNPGYENILRPVMAPCFSIPRDIHAAGKKLYPNS